MGGYSGDIVTNLPEGLDFGLVYAVIVSGDFPNPCGHALLYVPRQSNLGASGGYYFQVAEVYGNPRMMTSEGYQRYLKENKKKELKRYAVSVSKPSNSEAKLRELVGKKWVWVVLPNNCAAFVEDVVRAGGSSAGLWSNCPKAESFDRPFYETVPERAKQFVNDLERQIYHLYGVPYF